MSHSFCLRLLLSSCSLLLLLSTLFGSFFHFNLSPSLRLLSFFLGFLFSDFFLLSLSLFPILFDLCRSLSSRLSVPFLLLFLCLFIGFSLLLVSKLVGFALGLLLLSQLLGFLLLLGDAGILFLLSDTVLFSFLLSGNPVSFSFLLSGSPIGFSLLLSGNPVSFSLFSSCDTIGFSFFSGNSFGFSFFSGSDPFSFSSLSLCLSLDFSIGLSFGSLLSKCKFTLSLVKLGYSFILYGGGYSSGSGSFLLFLEFLSSKSLSCDPLFFSLFSGCDPINFGLCLCGCLSV